LSLCYDFQKWTIVTLGLVTIPLTVGLISIAHGQNDSSSMVDKLIENTKKNQTAGQSYRAELVNKLVIENECIPKQYQHLVQFMKISDLEMWLKSCVEQGIVK
jgi:hypothetical protein